MAKSRSLLTTVVVTFAALVGSSGVASARTRVQSAARAAFSSDMQACAKVRAANPHVAEKSYSVGNAPIIPGFETVSKSDPNKIVGFDPDFFAALASCLGIKYSFSQMAFDALIPALQAKRVDLVISNLIASPARAKEVRFDIYQRDIEGFIVRKGNPLHITSVAALCGKSIAVFPGTLQQGLAEAQSAKCSAEKKGTLQVNTYQDFNGCVQAVVTGRSDATIDPVSVADAAVAQFPTKLSATGSIPPLESRIGIAFNLGSAALQKAILGAIVAVQAAGIEKMLLTKWKQDPNTQAAAIALN